MNDTARDPAPAVTRALRVLELLEQSGGAPLTLSDLARALGAAKSSTSNICAVLEDGGMIRRVEAGSVGEVALAHQRRFEREAGRGEARGLFGRDDSRIGIHDRLRHL